MRVNIYAEEMPDDIEKGVELTEKTIDGRAYVAVRFWLHLPVSIEDETVSSPANPGVRQVKGPFMHRPGDDDSSAVTFWGKRDMRPMLRRALALLDQHYASKP